MAGMVGLAGLTGSVLYGAGLVGGAGAVPPAPPSPPVPVVTTTAARQDFPVTVEGLGTVTAYNSVDVRPQVAGTIQKIGFTEGRAVQAGDLLAQIDPRPYQAALEQAQASLTSDQATLANQQADLARYQPLAAKGYATAQQLDTQKAAVLQAQARIKSDQAAIDNARTQLGYTTIEAPIPGVTGLRRIDVGNLVQSGDSRSIVTITQVQPIAVVFVLPQQNLPAIQAAMAKDSLTVEAYDQNGSRLLDRGRLSVVDNAVDAKTGTIRLKAEFPNAARALWPGGFVNVRLVVETRPGAVTLPAAAIQSGPQGSFVYLVNGGKAKARPVKTGPQAQGTVVIEDGVAAGDTVVLDGQSRLTPGLPVAATAAASGTA
jgi:multidrug efflux system membrane fusion protein